MPDQPDKEEFSITLAKAHLDTEMTDYVILGFKRGDAPLKLKEFYNVGSIEALEKIRELFIIRVGQEIIKNEQ